MWLGASVVNLQCSGFKKSQTVKGILMNSSGKLRLGILASGEGTTLQAIYDACSSGRLNAEVVCVIGNNRDSGALKKARSHALTALHLSGVTHPDPDALDQAILAALLHSKAELVVLAGYLKKVGPKTLTAFRGRILNTHPALLPKYGGQGMYGRRVYEAVLAAGDKETGVTVHEVDDEYDHGSIVAQTVVPIMSDDDVNTLSTRVQAAERAFLVKTIQTIGAQRASAR
jgi:phosphoribosylglycinamide formyltransferase-1